MSAEEVKKDVLEPLGVKCSTTHCVSDRHYFRQTKKMREGKQPPRCKDCGADLVNWDRVRQRDLGDVAHTFAALKYEFIRHHYWHREFDQRAINYAKRKGRIELLETAEARIHKSLGKPADAFDWCGTKWEGNPIFYAQHATATCCRKCVEKWHGIPRDQELTEDQLKYLTRLVILYLEERLPDLPDYKQKVPRIPKDSSENKEKKS